MPVLVMTPASNPILHRTHRPHAQRRSFLLLSFLRLFQRLPYQLELPANSKTVEEVLQEAELHLSLGDLDWENGAMSGTVYNSNKELGKYLHFLLS